MIPAWLWFPPPRLVGIAAAIAISSFSSCVRLFAVGCPKILVAVSLWTSSRVSAQMPMFGSFGLFF
jgi:hypothetical protein